MALTFPLHDPSSLSLEDISQLLPNLLRFLMSWYPPRGAQFIDEDIWFREAFPDTVGKCFEYDRPSGKRYINYLADGGGRFSFVLPSGVAANEVIHVKFPEDIDSFVITALQKSLVALENTELFAAYSGLIRDVIDWIQNGAAPHEELGCLDQLRAHFLEKHSDPAVLDEMGKRIFSLFYAYRFRGESLSDFLILRHFSVIAGLGRLTGKVDSFTMEDQMCIFNALGLQESLVRGALSEPNGMIAIKQAASDLIKEFSKPIPRERLFQVRSSTVIALGERLYFDGRRFVHFARQAKSMSSFYDYLFCAYPILRTSLICFDGIIPSLAFWKEEEEKIKILRREVDELIARIHSVLAFAYSFAPSELFISAASDLVRASWEGTLSKNKMLVHIFDNQFLYPEICREAILSEIDRGMGNPNFSEEFSAFVGRQFRSLLFPPWSSRESKAN